MALNLMKAVENFGEGLAVVVHGRVSVFAPKTTVRSPQKNWYQHFSPKDCSRACGAFAWPQNSGRAGSALAVWPARRLTMAGFGK
jgi:hypothetical protein